MNEENFVEMMDREKLEREARRKAFLDELYKDEAVDLKRRARDIGMMDPETGEMFVPRDREDAKRAARKAALEELRQFEKNKASMEDVENVKLKAMFERAMNAESPEEQEAMVDRIKKYQELFKK